jgi:hypothetical protein
VSYCWAGGQGLTLKGRQLLAGTSRFHRGFASVGQEQLWSYSCCAARGIMQWTWSQPECALA